MRRTYINSLKKVKSLFQEMAKTSCTFSKGETSKENIERFLERLSDIFE